ncbi:hypothetical protein BH24CHL5_BH24CHL5_06210 [soil metagenome]
MTPRASNIVPAGMVSLAAAGVAIALYLSWVKLSGGQPYCGPLVGCETVNTSAYSALFGIPTALFGAGASATALAGILAWWRRGQRKGLLLAYVIGLASLPVLGYLTYLELFVIHAVCAWCVAYALTVLGGWTLAAWALFRHADQPNGSNGPLEGADRHS